MEKIKKNKDCDMETTFCLLEKIRSDYVLEKTFLLLEKKNMKNVELGSGNNIPPA